MWGNIITESSFQNNFNTGFSNAKSDILINLSQWQYWWWFWFVFLWCFYYLLIIRISRFRTLKFQPKIVTSMRPHGKWGDLIVCLIPSFWCANILINSGFLLRMIEWQNESSLFTLRIRGKQWYWIYKFDVRDIAQIFSANKNVGFNKWMSPTHGSLENIDDYLHTVQLRWLNVWYEKYWTTLEKSYTKEQLEFFSSSTNEVYRRDGWLNILTNNPNKLPDLHMYLSPMLHRAFVSKKSNFTIDDNYYLQYKMNKNWKLNARNPFKKSLKYVYGYHDYFNKKDYLNLINKTFNKVEYLKRAHVLTKSDFLKLFEDWKQVLVDLNGFKRSQLIKSFEIFKNSASFKKKFKLNFVTAFAETPFLRERVYEAINLNDPTLKLLEWNLYDHLEYYNLRDKLDYPKRENYRTLSQLSNELWSRSSVLNKKLLCRHLRLLDSFRFKNVYGPLVKRNQSFIGENFYNFFEPLYDNFFKKIMERRLNLKAKYSFFYELNVFNHKKPITNVEKITGSKEIFKNFFIDSAENFTNFNKLTFTGNSDYFFNKFYKFYDFMDIKKIFYDYILSLRSFQRKTNFFSLKNLPNNFILTKQLQNSFDAYKEAVDSSSMKLYSNKTKKELYNDLFDAIHFKKLPKTFLKKNVVWHKQIYNRLTNFVLISTGLESPVPYNPNYAYSIKDAPYFLKKSFLALEVNFFEQNKKYLSSLKEDFLKKKFFKNSVFDDNNISNYFFPKNFFLNIYSQYRVDLLDLVELFSFRFNEGIVQLYQQNNESRLFKVARLSRLLNERRDDPQTSKFFNEKLFGHLDKSDLVNNLFEVKDAMTNTINNLNYGHLYNTSNSSLFNFSKFNKDINLIWNYEFTNFKSKNPLFRTKFYSSDSLDRILKSRWSSIEGPSLYSYYNKIYGRGLHLEHRQEWDYNAIFKRKAVLNKDLTDNSRAVHSFFFENPDVQAALKIAYEKNLRVFKSYILSDHWRYKPFSNFLGLEKYTSIVSNSYLYDILGYAHDRIDLYYGVAKGYDAQNFEKLYRYHKDKLTIKTSTEEIPSRIVDLKNYANSCIPHTSFKNYWQKHFSSYLFGYNLIDDYNITLSTNALVTNKNILKEKRDFNNWLTESSRINHLRNKFTNDFVNFHNFNFREFSPILGILKNKKIIFPFFNSLTSRYKTLNVDCNTIFENFRTLNNLRQDTACDYDHLVSAYYNSPLSEGSFKKTNPHTSLYNKLSVFQKNFFFQKNNSFAPMVASALKLNLDNNLLTKDKLFNRWSNVNPGNSFFVAPEGPLNTKILAINALINNQPNVSGAKVYKRYATLSDDPFFLNIFLQFNLISNKATSFIEKFSFGELKDVFVGSESKFNSLVVNLFEDTFDYELSRTGKSPIVSIYRLFAKFRKISEFFIHYYYKPKYYGFSKNPSKGEAFFNYFYFHKFKELNFFSDLLKEGKQDFFAMRFFCDKTKFDKFTNYLLEKRALPFRQNLSFITSFKRGINLDDGIRWIKRGYGAESALTILKNDLSKPFDSLFTIKFLTDDSIESKNVNNNPYFVIKQKRYSPKKKLPVSKVFLNSKSYSSSEAFKELAPLKTNLWIKHKFSVENIDNLLYSYKFFQKNKKRSETFSIVTARRLLRTRRTLVLPSHTNMTVITNSFDVVHSWFIPGLGIKFDCIPGRATHHTFYIDNVGFYYGQCAEICGRYHHHMPIRVCVLPFDQFLVWWHHFGLPKLTYNTTNNKVRNMQVNLRKYTW